MKSTPLRDTNTLIKLDNNISYREQLVPGNISNGILVVDDNWTVTTWNTAAVELLGIKAADIIGRNLWEAFAGIIPVNFYGDYHQLLPKQVPVYFEGYWPQMETYYEIITCYSEGSLFFSFKKKYPLRNQGYPAQQLKILHELYEFVTQVTNDCLWEWDIRNKVIFWIDGGHKRMFGYPMENTLIPQAFWEIRIHPDDKLRVLAKLNSIMAEGVEASWEDEYRLKKENGDYAHVYDRAHIIYENKKPLRMIGATQDITTKRLIQKNLTDTRTQLVQERLARQQDITNAVLKAQENERTSIGKELHDNLNQILGAAKLYIELAKTDKDIMDLCLTKSSDYIVLVIEELRRMGKALIPQLLVLGLKDSIKGLLYDLNLTNPIKITFEEEGPEEQRLNEHLQLAIFRIIQEQLTNIIKHSKATFATIKLSKNSDGIVLTITDNGQGCNTTEKKEGVGIRNIISRTELFEGNVAIESNPGKGYELKIFFPLHLALA